MSFTIGSLFDGSGGFPLAGFLCGGIPVWASEIEPYPIAVTKSRFPYMKHLGSVTDIKGDEIDPVDVITFGSPCQDLSVAGKRAGLKHEDNGDDETTRSGLFMEAVRIIKEMREATNGEYPRFALWENVPGAFSSNKGEDFRIVLEELIKVAEPTAVMPSVPQKGWAYADSHRGNGWSIAYRVLDAQYWGVPQRRRRIYLVADFRGERAGEVLFEREGLRGYFAQSGSPWETAPGDIEVGTGAADCERKCYGISSFNSNSMLSDNPNSGIYEATTSRTLDLNGGNPSCNQGGIAIVEPIAFMRQLGGVETKEGVSPTILAAAGESGNNQPCVAIPYTLKIRSGCEGGGKGALIQDDLSATLATNNDQYLFQPIVLDDQGGSVINVRTDGMSPTLRAETHGNLPCVMRPVSVMASSAVNAETTDGTISPCLMARAGTGGNQLPLVALTYDARGNGDGATASTITGDHNNRITDYTSLVVECCIDGDKIGKAEREGGSGLGIRPGDKMYTLTAKDKHAVAYSMKSIARNGVPLEEQANPICASDWKDPDIVAYLASGKDSVGTLMASMATKQCLGDQEAFSGDYHIIEENNLQPVQYIVRRLTPTECARLQGFADCWGHPDHKDDFTDEEYSFWLNVRNTHAEINGKQVKDYTKAQMLTWYNKLHTDSSEYKMWGNGIALPTALYVMEGISDVYTSV